MTSPVSTESLTTTPLPHIERCTCCDRSPLAHNPDAHECRACFGYGHFDAEGRVTLGLDQWSDVYGVPVRACADCGGAGFVAKAVRS